MFAYRISLAPSLSLHLRRFSFYCGALLLVDVSLGVRYAKFRFSYSFFFCFGSFFSFVRAEHTYRAVGAAVRRHTHPPEPSSIRVPLLFILATAFERQHFYTRYNIKALIHKYITMICGLNVSALEFGIKEAIALNAWVRPRLPFSYFFVPLRPIKTECSRETMEKQTLRPLFGGPVVAGKPGRKWGRGKQNSNVLLKIYVYFGFIKYELT